MKEMPTYHKKHKAVQITRIVRYAKSAVKDREFVRIEPFLGRYFEGVSPEEVDAMAAEAAFQIAAEHWALLQQRRKKVPTLNIYNPKVSADDEPFRHTIIQIIADDMPFLVDSVTMELNRQGFNVNLMIHPVFDVIRDKQGKLKQIFNRGAGDKEAQSESLIYIEIDRIFDQDQLQTLEDGLAQVLADVSRAVTDWPKICNRLYEVADELNDSAASSEKVDEVKAFLNWLDEKNFTFLGYQSYELAKGNRKQQVLKPVKGSALGVLRNPSFRSAAGHTLRLPAGTKESQADENLLLVTKSVRLSSVHRPGYMDYIIVRRLDGNGRIVGEHRFLGLYTSMAYRRHPKDVPIIRKKIENLTSRVELNQVSHTGKAFLHILESFPRDELFQISEDDLLDIAQGILHLGERQRLKLFVREDSLSRFVWCLVYVPKDSYDTDLRIKMSDIILRGFNGQELTSKVKLGDESFGRVEYFVRTDPDNFPSYDLAAIEQQLQEVSQSWEEHLRNALLSHFPEAECPKVLGHYGQAFPVSYQYDFTADTAVDDIQRLQQVQETGKVGVQFYQCEENGSSQLRLKLYTVAQPIAPSDSLPILENMGFKVLQGKPYKIVTSGKEVSWIHDHGLEYKASSVELTTLRPIVEDVFTQVWHQSAENDGINALALYAGLSHSENLILRSYCKYLLQTGLTFSQSYIQTCLQKHAAISMQLVKLFSLRFDPDLQTEQSARQVSALQKKILSMLDEVKSLDEDRILRNFMGVILATVRTDFYQPLAKKAEHKHHVAFKFDTSKVPELPEPRPMFEVFVYSPRFEGVHLRSSKVARGGLRWSDRREDFRTEVLGLVKAQKVKNAVIVPSGAKGGFVVKQLPEGGREEVMEEVVDCYKQFISALLNLSDNVKANKILPPPKVVRYDGDDPYLVVAADKGTATFSDHANQVALDRGFWLGDAFASGGSVGYDHKKMGITARGAWESVKLHFRDLGKNIQSQDFTVVGIGDMAGDVFGNGMLLSRHTRLVAAFNHMHIFLDPSPDAKVSYQERKRLFKLTRSTWADYKSELISKGGGVFSRSAKSIELSPQVQQLLGTQKKSIAPNDLIQLILKAPVDLLWNGGVGTYVKAAAEQDGDVGDRSNDALRINAGDLRCKVVGEGGNLGLTQRARIEYALQGGKVDSDFIHNAGGVDCSDHEVNIKILLNMIVAAGGLTEKQRVELLKEMTDEVGQLVLQSNYWQGQAITLIDVEAPKLLDEHSRYMKALESSGVLNREIEALPHEEQLSERKAEGRGLTRPEIAVLVSYSKITAHAELVDSDLWDDPYFAAELLRYFPTALRQRYADYVHKHPLRKEILANFIVNRMINRMGCTFVARVQEETGATTAEITRAYTIAWEVFNLRSVWSEIAELDHKIPAQSQNEIMLEARRLIYRASKWLIQHRKSSLGINQAINDYGSGAAFMAKRLPVILETSQDPVIRDGLNRFVEQGVDKSMAVKAVGIDAFYCIFDIVDVCNKVNLPVNIVLDTYFQLSAYLDAYWLRVQIRDSKAESHWQDLARSALIDDLYEVLKDISSEVLRGCSRKDKPDQAIAQWHEQNQQPVDRCLKMFQDLKSTEYLDFAMFAVAIRELQAVYQASVAD